MGSLFDPMTWRHQMLWDGTKRDRGAATDGERVKERIVLFIHLFAAFIYLSRAKYFLSAPSHLPLVHGACSQTQMGAWNWGREREFVFRRREGGGGWRRRSKGSLGGRVCARWETESNNPVMPQVLAGSWGQNWQESLTRELNCANYTMACNYETLAWSLVPVEEAQGRL